MNEVTVTLGDRVFRKKTLPEYFQANWEHIKNFEIRRDDEGVMPGDRIWLAEYDRGRYTGRSMFRKVKYVLRDCPEYGLMPGYCIIGF